MCLRLYGTGVAILLNQAPVGQPQLAPVTGEQVIGVYSDQLRTEVGAQAVRQFTAVVAVSDLTWSAQPATPPPGVTRLYADSNGTLHYLLPSGTDRTLIDTGNLAANVATQPLGGDLFGTVSAGHVGVQYGSALYMYDSAGTLRQWVTVAGNETRQYAVSTGIFSWLNQSNTAYAMTLSQTGQLGVTGSVTAQSYYFQNTSNYLTWDGSYYYFNHGLIIQSGPLMVQSGVFNISDGTNGIIAASPQNLYLRSGNQYSVIVDQGQLYVPGRVTASNNSIVGVYNIWSTQGGISTGEQMAGGWPIAGDLNIKRPGQNVGYAFFANTGMYIGYDGSVFQMVGAQVAIHKNLTINSDRGVNQASILFMANASANDVNTFAENGNFYMWYPGSIICQGPSGAGFKPIAASAFNVNSTRAIKDNLQPIDNPLSVILHPELHGMTYNDNTKDNVRRVGFVVEDWHPIIPEIVALDENGEPYAMDYGAVGAFTFEALKVYVIETNARLSALEGRIDRAGLPV
jgi:hypothetical protein